MPLHYVYITEVVWHVGWFWGFRCLYFLSKVLSPLNSSCTTMRASHIPVVQDTVRGLDWYVSGVTCSFRCSRKKKTTLGVSINSILSCFLHVGHLLHIVSIFFSWYCLCSVHSSTSNWSAFKKIYLIYYRQCFYTVGCTSLGQCSHQHAIKIFTVHKHGIVFPKVQETKFGPSSI